MPATDRSAPPGHRAPGRAPRRPAAPPPSAWRDYVAIARPDYWFKNVFMLAGVAAAAYFEPSVLRPAALPRLLLAVVATCLVASANYVLNEILDAPLDRHHPAKRTRPLADGRISPRLALAEMAAIGALGLGVAASLDRPFLLSALALLTMGVIYNVPPLRTKEVVYLDVLSESVNNPIRLLLGWYGAGATGLPPTSLVIAYWAIGGFLMAGKRFAEYRAIGDPAQAAAYRRSFARYTIDRLLISVILYAATFMFFFGVFLVKHHVELVLVFPLVLLFLGYYVRLIFEEDSVAQTPEHLVRRPAFILLSIACFAAMVILAWVRIPGLAEWLGLVHQTSP
jgi:decaprenyl-phosphate phosphoribosyltransferase